MSDDPSHSELPVTPPAGGPEGVGGGRNFREVTAAEGPLGWPVVRWITLQIADALEPLHEEGRAHGNLSAGNLRLAEPWSDLTVILPEATHAGSPAEDLADLEGILRQLLGNAPPDAEASAILSAMQGKGVPDAAALTDLLATCFIDSLPEEEPEEVR